LLCPTFSPSVPYPGANAPWKGSCLGCGAEVSPRYANLSQGRGPCIACAHKRRGAQSRFSDADARENVTKWAPAFLPSVPYPGALEPWLGICLDCGNTVQPKYHSLQQGAGHCPECGRLRSIQSRRLTDEVARASAAEFDPDFTPTSPYPGNNGTNWPGTCNKCGKVVRPTYAHLQQGGAACAFCAGAKVDTDFAFARYLEAGGTPKIPYPGKNNVPWPGTCNKCRKMIAPTWANIKKTGRGVCNYCAKKASGASRKLDAKSTVRFVQSLGFEPQEKFPGLVTDPWLLVHTECGKQMRKTYNYLQSGHGCPECSTYYFSLDAPGFFYVVASQTWIKPGITNVPKRRLAEHRMQGLSELVYMVEFASGREALALEREWLAIRAEQIPEDSWARIEDLPNGYTEAVRRTVEAEVLIKNLLESN